MKMLALLLLTPLLHANERRFAYTYETPTLPAGAVEIEPWTTLVPQDAGALSFRHRLEFELGVSNRVMTALYFNWRGDVGDFAWSGVSNEWKWNVLSRAIQPVGLALYAEAQIGPEEAELEAKILLDVEKGPFVVAVDLVGEWEGKRETELADDGTLTARLVPEFLVQGYVAASYELKNRLAGGVEVRSSTRLPEAQGAQTTLFVGPALSYRSTGWWVALTPLFPAFHVVPEGDALIDDHPWEGRLLLGFHL